MPTDHMLVDQWAKAEIDKLSMVLDEMFEQGKLPCERDIHRLDIADLLVQYPMPGRPAMKKDSVVARNLRKESKDD